MVIEHRTYGDAGPQVVLLHGGPGAPGYMASLARELSRWFRVIEPLQRRSGGEALTVAGHVADLRDLLRVLEIERGALVGSSWGAMLALAFAAAHPEKAGPLVLVGSGTFDGRSRARMAEILDARMGREVSSRIGRVDTDEQLEAMGDLLLPFYSYDLVTSDLEIEAHDARGFRETWGDMVRLQDEGLYPAAFAVVESPVLMLHGDRDPHPGAMIRESLEPFISELEYRELRRCGHYPWLERYAREEFLEELRSWLTHQIMDNGPD